MPRQIGVVRRRVPPVLPSVDGDLLVPLPAETTAPAPAPAPLPVKARLGRIMASGTDVYRLPDPRSQWVGRVKQDEKVAIVSQWQGWFAIIMGDGSQAYVPQVHVEVLPFQVQTVLPQPQVVQPPAALPVPPADATQGLLPPDAVSSPLARAIIEEAFRYQGTRYVWGGNSTSGIDCSGLVKNCFAAQGIQLPRRASEQARIGQEVPLTELQPGDRLYFSVKHRDDHTGIYLGNGYFIHAGRGRGNVGVDHLSQRLYQQNLTGARRS